MAHNINYNDRTGKYSFFSVQEKAWHGLGQIVSDYPTSQQAIVAAGLDYNVVKTPLLTKGQALHYNEQGLKMENEEIEVKNYFANLRTDNNTVLGVVGKDYQIVQNRDAFGFFDAIDGELYQQGCWQQYSSEGTHAEWYKYTPTADGVLRVNTIFNENNGIGNTNAPKLSVYYGTCSQLQCHVKDGAPAGIAPYLTDTEFEVHANTTYYITFDDFWSTKKIFFELSFSPSECLTTLPYHTDFSSLAHYACWKPYPEEGSQTWKYNALMYLNGPSEPLPVASSLPVSDGLDKSQWLISRAFSLQEGTLYSLQIKYNALPYVGETVSESFRIVILDQRNPAIALENEIGIVQDIVSQGNETSAGPPYNYALATTGNFSFACPQTGDYFIGIQSITEAAESGILLIYEVSLDTNLSTGPPDLKNKAILHPNPSSDIVRVTLPQGVGIHTMEVFDLHGKHISLPIQSGQDLFEIDVKPLAAGIYFAKISSASGMTCLKFQKI